MKYRYIEIQSDGRGSYYVVADGQALSLHDDVKVAEAVRHALVAEVAAQTDADGHQSRSFYWQADCVHRWNRWGPELTLEPDNPALPTATVEIAPEHVARLPGFANKWVWTCWCEVESGAWIGPFDTELAAMDACDLHFASGLTQLFWGDDTVDDINLEDEPPEPIPRVSS